MLVTLNTSMLSTEAQENLSHCMGEDDALLLIGDGLFALRDEVLCQKLQAWHKNGISLYALQTDLDARIQTGNLIMDHVTLIDYAGWVELTETHERCLAW